MKRSSSARTSRPRARVGRVSRLLDQRLDPEALQCRRVPPSLLCRQPARQPAAPADVPDACTPVRAETDMRAKRHAGPRMAGGQPEQSETAAADHQTDLGHGRENQRRLDIALHQRTEAAVHGGRQTDDRQQRQQVGHLLRADPAGDRADRRRRAPSANRRKSPKTASGLRARARSMA
jgi:hypothetical protein